MELMGLGEMAKELSKERWAELVEMSVEMTVEIRTELRRDTPNGEHVRYLWAKVKSTWAWFYKTSAISEYLFYFIIFYCIDSAVPCNYAPFTHAAIDNNSV